jgi:cytochrome c5
VQPRIQPDTPGATLTPQQARFNELVRDVALRRDALAQWQQNVEHHERATAPLRRQLHAAFRQWVFALDAASLQPGFSRAERAQLDEMLRDTAAALLQSQADDADVAAVLARHPEPPPAAVEEPQAEVDWQAAADAAAAQREAASARRRADRARQRRSKPVQEASQSVRDVYRRVASVLHPDREADPALRARKTAWMQQANQAYADGNLLALLELQLHAEQVNTGAPAAVDDRRLQHYIAVLQEQLAELQSETRRIEADFRADAGLAPGTGLQPRKAERATSAEAQRLREELLLLERQARLLADVDATKDWLRALRKAPRFS